MTRDVTMRSVSVKIVIWKKLVIGMVSSVYHYIPVTDIQFFADVCTY